MADRFTPGPGTSRRPGMRRRKTRLNRRDRKERREERRQRFAWLVLCAPGDPCDYLPPRSARSISSHGGANQKRGMPSVLTAMIPLPSGENDTWPNADLVGNVRIPRVAPAQLLLIEPPLDARPTQRLGHTLRRVRIRGGVTRKNGLFRWAHDCRLAIDTKRHPVAAA